MSPGGFSEEEDIDLVNPRFIRYSLLHVTQTTLNLNRIHLGMVSSYVSCLFLIALLMQIFT